MTIFRPDSNNDNGAEANHVYGTIYWKCIINDVANRAREYRRRRRRWNSNGCENVRTQFAPSHYFGMGGGGGDG